MTTALVAIGANLPWRGRAPAETVLAAIEALGARDVVAARSDLWTSPAWPDAARPPYVNAVARLETSSPPAALLARLMRVEAGFGRVRAQANEDRTLDLDLIDYDGCSIEKEGALTIPHPRAHERAFVLIPLSEVAPTWRHPKLGLAARDLIEALPADQRAGVQRLR